MGECTPIEPRFLSKIAVNAESGCWTWQRQITRGGYARFSAYGKSVAAHRFAYEHFIGPIPDGMTLDHTCHTNDPLCTGGVTCLHRRCVRPDHLVPMPAAVNVSLAFPSRKTHCRWGHEFTGENTSLLVSGTRTKRRCRKCRYRRKNEARSAIRAAARAVRLPKPRPTHCRYGHPYAGENLYVVPGTGAWQCKTCGRASEERRKARRRAETAAKREALAQAA